MADPSYPKSAEAVIDTLTEIFRYQKRPEIVTILEKARARFDDVEQDSWDARVTYWKLHIEIPPELFASIESNLQQIEHELIEKTAYLNRQYDLNPLREITISPITNRNSDLGLRGPSSDSDTSHIWPPDYFKLFVSHVSNHALAVSKLKDELILRGVAAFVAHQDIKPSLEWQQEIELALQSMDALAALFTPDYHQSDWTDQETGWALGRGKLVVPVRLGSDPYGFTGKIQGITGYLEQPVDLAIRIVETLLRNSRTRGNIRRSMISTLALVNSFAKAQALIPCLIQIGDFYDEEKDVIWRVCSENRYISGADEVLGMIKKAIGEPKKSMTTNLVEIPF